MISKMTDFAQLLALLKPVIAGL